LKNEITRITTVKALTGIAYSPFKIDLSPILADSVEELASFLRKKNRPLKQVSLRALSAITTTYGASIKPDQLTEVLTEAAVLISDSDLQLAHFALLLCVDVVRVNNSTTKIIQEKTLPKVVELIHSSLLQGTALESLLLLFAELVKINKVIGFPQLLDLLLADARSAAAMSKQSISSTAQCIAIIAVTTSADQRDSTVTKFIAEIKSQKTPDTAKILYLFSLGEIGRRSDLSKHDSLQQVVLGALESPSEDVKTAASYALGNIAVGNMAKYLPFVLQEINKDPKRQYLLLHSLKEIISRLSLSNEGVAIIQPYTIQILNLLFGNAESEEESLRNVVAECLGKLALIFPNDLVPTLKERITAKSAATRGTVITALKFTITEKPQPIDQSLAMVMGNFMTLLRDSDLNVRRASLLTLNYAAHNKPNLIRDLLSDKILPTLYEETKIKPELIHQVDLGPFKHTVDDGLESRKAAFSCMYTLLETCLAKLEVSAFVTHLVDGLKDHYDIKMLCHLMLSRLAVAAPAAVLQALDLLVEPLQATITTKVKDGAVKQELERNDELIRSALRAIVSLTKIPDVQTNIKFDQFIKNTVKSAELLEKFEAVQKEGDPRSPDDLMEVDS